jgi:hypothetical protein
LERRRLLHFGFAFELGRAAINNPSVLVPEKNEDVSQRDRPLPGDPLEKFGSEGKKWDGVDILHLGQEGVNAGLNQLLDFLGGGLREADEVDWSLAGNWNPLFKAMSSKLVHVRHDPVSEQIAFCEQQEKKASGVIDSLGEVVEEGTDEGAVVLVLRSKQALQVVECENDGHPDEGTGLEDDVEQTLDEIGAEAGPGGIGVQVVVGEEARHGIVVPQEDGAGQSGIKQPAHLNE